MARVFLSLGCNIGDCRTSLEQALAGLDNDASTRVVKVSSVYITEPVGMKDQPDFFNIVAELETGHDPGSLLRFCREIEVRLGGREGRTAGGPRTIDIDIILFEQAVLSEKDLDLPHPRMAERAFVLVPLEEIAPELPLPDGRSVSEALADLKDTHQVEKTGALESFQEGKLG